MMGTNDQFDMDVTLYYSKLLDIDFVPKNHLNLDWGNTLAVYRVDQLYEKYGNPYMINEFQGGTVVWKYVPPLNPDIVKGHYDEISVSDNAYFHDKPKPHFDFLKMTIPMKLKMSTLKKLHDITGSASYHPVTGLLSASCHFTGASIGTFAIIKQYDKGEITADGAREKYNTTIAELAKEESKSMNGGDENILANYPFRNIMEKYIFTDFDFVPFYRPPPREQTGGLSRS